MFKLIPAALLGLLVSAGPALSQNYDRRDAYRGGPAALVRSWYRQYLHRDPDPEGWRGWTEALRDGESPRALLARILGGDEYYAQAGNSPERFIESLFLDVVGRQPTGREYRYWLDRLDSEGPEDLAYDFLGRYGRGRRPLLRSGRHYTAYPPPERIPDD